jgi:hypothetical protein
MPPEHHGLPVWLWHKLKQLRWRRARLYRQHLACGNIFDASKYPNIRKIATIPNHVHAVESTKPQAPCRILYELTFQAHPLGLEVKTKIGWHRSSGSGLQWLVRQQEHKCNQVQDKVDFYPWSSKA